jgi:hypothetical protein
VWRSIGGLLILILGGCTQVGTRSESDVFDAGAEAALPDSALIADDVGPLDAALLQYEGPAHLHETGLYDPSGAIAEDVVEFTPRLQLYSDGADKRRFLWLPEGSSIDVGQRDDWRLPVGTKAWKEFRVDGVLVETRYLEKVDAQRWEAVAYVWRADGSEADAAPLGMADALGTTHDVPDVAACVQCHQGSDGLLGISAMGIDDRLFATLVQTGALSAQTERGVIPGDQTTREALGYLHVNCGSCHSARHPLARFRAMRARVPVGLERPELAPAVRTLLGARMTHEIDGTRVGLVPGDASGSQLWRRMQHRGDPYSMPPLGSEVVDEGGATLIRKWIEEMR